MKKLSAVLATLVILAVAGCGSAGGGGSSQRPEPVAPFIVDLSKLPFTKNARPFTKQYDDLLIPLPEFPGVDFTKYRRVTIKMKFFTPANVEKQPTWQSNAIVSLVYDVNAGDAQLRGGANVPLKEFNGGMTTADATVSTDRGSVVRFTKAPGGVLLQNSGSHTDTGYIQLVLLVFHNGDYVSE
jgi:hypothetical protein